MLHLIHPALVHFALAFAVAGAAAEAAGILAKRPGLERWGGATVLAGAACLVLAVASGYLAANTAPGFTPGAEAALGGHERMALVATGGFLLLVVWKGLCGGRVPDAQRRLYAAASLAAAAAVLWAAVLGGGLVYDRGVGVDPPALTAPG